MPLALPNPRLAAALLALLAAPPGLAGEAAGKEGCAHCDAEKARAAERRPASAADASVTLVDRTLRDQDGRAVRFPRDVIGRDVVVMDFVFTHCTTVCPVLSAKMARLQQLLGDRLGKGVRLASLSLDPVRDTPERLKAWGARFRAGPHWQLVTGAQPDQEEVLRGLGAYVPDFASHSPLLLVGDGATGRWVRVNGFPDPQKVVALVDELRAGRHASAARPERN
ncbi:MAG: SCO family protein [Deltaproteobacteria bacterium]|nr:SCO family protein [Deltaproteobacteria bacterium]